MKLRLIKKLCLFVGVAAALSAANAVLPTTPNNYLGIGRTIQVKTAYQNGAGTNNGGGAFNGVVSGTGLAPFDTTFWCIDAQNTFSPGATDFGNILALGGQPAGLNIADDPTKVQFGGVGLDGWTNKTDVFNELDMVDRYRMAAYLITQYNFKPDGPQFGLDGDSSDKQTHNNAVQNTIWALMKNNAAGNGDGVSNLYDATLLTAAKNSLTSTFNFNEWAVVSWATNSAGMLKPNSSNQTFLVQIQVPETVLHTVPEPGFYGLLCSGLGALVWTVNRRKKNADAAV